MPWETCELQRARDAQRLEKVKWQMEAADELLERDFPAILSQTPSVSDDFNRHSATKAHKCQEVSRLSHTWVLLKRLEFMSHLKPGITNHSQELCFMIKPGI